eukprot:scaffold23754_cov48-Phaeocystis_antarctica.AAC.1
MVRSMSDYSPSPSPSPDSNPDPNPSPSPSPNPDPDPNPNHDPSPNPDPDPNPHQASPRRVTALLPRGRSGGDGRGRSTAADRGWSQGVGGADDRSLLGW